MWKRIIIIAVLIGALVTLSLLFDKYTNKVEAPDFTEEEQIDENIIPLTVRHQYKDGAHTFVGDLELPSPCHAYNAFIEDGEKENIKNIIVEITEPKEEVCAQVITNVTFRVSVEGSEDLQFKAFVNGEARRLNIFDLEPEVDIDQFELFIKG